MEKYSFVRSGLKIFFGVFLATLSVNAFADPLRSYIRNNADGSQTLTGHMPLEVRNASASFRYHANININAQIILPLQNQSQLSNLLEDLYNPKSPNFHHFLIPVQFAQQFAPSAVDSIEVQQFLAREGIVVTGTSANGAVMNVAGPVGAFERSFGLHVNYYQRNDGTMFFSPDAEPTIPATLAGKILAVGGLDNLPKYRAHHFQSLTTALPKAVGTGPGGFLAPNDVKTAYNLKAVPATGSGQGVAVFELDGYTASDITHYEAQFGLPNVPLQNVLIDGFSGTPTYGSNGGGYEVTIDIELVAAFAPGSNIFVYEAANTTQAWIDEWSKIASDNKAKVVSCSWGEPEMDSPTLSFDNMIFQEMAAQGQAVFVAAGDSGAFDAGGNTLAVDEPASQPLVTAVGISKLTTASGGAYSSETASIFGGGGISGYWSIPSYQTAAAAQAVKAAMVSTAKRNLPDVVLTADAATPYAFYVNGSWEGFYGSSLSSPIWASFISLVNQGLGQNAPIGSVNSMLYQLAQTGNYTNDFHDIAAGNNGYYPAEAGFDDATGLGSFNGLNLYNDLLKNAVAKTPPSQPTGLGAAAGNVQVLLSWTASLGANSYNVKRATVSGGPYTTIATSVLNPTYTDNLVTNGTTYYYVVSAVNSAGESSNSSQVSAKPVLPVPSVPGGLVASSGNAKVFLSWNSTTGAASYDVKRSTVNGGPYTIIAVGATAPTYTDVFVNNNTTYYYVVSAVNTSGQSTNSAQVSAMPSASTAVAAVTNLTGTATTYFKNPAVLLQWSQSTSPNIKYNNIYISIGSGIYVKLGSISATTAVTVLGINSGVPYNFYITAVNTSGMESSASNKISIVVPQVRDR